MLAGLNEVVVARNCDEFESFGGSYWPEADAQQVKLMETRYSALAAVVMVYASAGGSGEMKFERKRWVLFFFSERRCGLMEERTVSRREQ